MEIERDCRNLARRWQLKLRPPADADDVLPVAWGRNRAFMPRFISVLRLQSGQAGDSLRGIAIAVDGRTPRGGSPIRLTLPPRHAVHFARAVLQAAGDRDAIVLDSIAALLDRQRWTGANDLDTIAALVRGTGRQIRDPEP